MEFQSVIGQLQNLGACLLHCNTLPRESPKPFWFIFLTQRGSLLRGVDWLLSESGTRNDHELLD